MNEAPLIFVTGKGGVGKSTIAAALALLEARRGRRALLVELGETSYFEQWLSQSIGHEPIQTMEPNLYVCRWEAQACLKEYLLHYLKVESLVNLFFENRVMRALVQAAPALREIALLGKITSGIRKIGPAMPYDVIIIDAFATGHFKALMHAPKGLAHAVRFGPMGEQSRAIYDILSDRKYSEYYVVSLPEELSVQEAVELSDYVKRNLGLEPYLVLNRYLTIPDALSVPSEVSSQHPFLEYLRAVQGRQQESLEVLKRHAPVRIVPQVFSRSPRNLLSMVSTALGGV